MGVGVRRITMPGTAINEHMRTPLRLLLILVAASACVDRSQHTASHPPTEAFRPLVVKRSRGPSTLSAIQRLVAADSSVTWEPRSVLVADIDCDGKPDSAFVGRSSERIAVGLVRAAASAPEVLPFGTHGGAQDALSSNAARLTLESLDYDPRNGDMGEIPGMQRSATCQGLNLDDGDTDPVHLFWNHASRHLDWWRE